MHRFPEQKCISEAGNKGPQLGAFSRGIRLASDYPPGCQHWRVHRRFPRREHMWHKVPLRMLFGERCAAAPRLGLQRLFAAGTTLAASLPVLGSFTQGT